MKKNIQFYKRLINEHMPMDNDQYERYLTYEGNSDKVINFIPKLSSGLIETNDPEYFINSSSWKYDSECSNVLITVFFVCGSTPQQFITLQLNLDTRIISIKEKSVVLEYEEELNTAIIKEMIPILECNKISFRD